VDTTTNLRLNKHLAHKLGVSRREADEIIEQGRVTINGRVATLGARFSETDTVVFDETLMPTTTPRSTYILLNKPIGYVCSRRRQGDAPTIYELLPEQYHSLKSVGRLDKDSSGVLLLTDDGDFAHRMTHPSFHKTKEYEVALDHDLEPLHQQMISDYGIELEDGRSQLTLARIHDDGRKEWTISMHEGRNRQIRRTFAALGYTVTKLHRTRFGNYAIHDIKNGEFKLTDIH